MTENLIMKDQSLAVQELLHEFSRGDAAAIDRVHQHLPQVRFGARDDAAAFPLTLRDAQTVIAREQGKQSWAELGLQEKLSQLELGDELENFKQLVYAKDAEKLDELARPPFPSCAIRWMIRTSGSAPRH